MLEQITPVILTYNEEPNIARTLDRLRWARDIVVVDSFSADKTLEIVRGLPQARLFQRKFDAHARQWNFAAFETGIVSDWILALDADYIVTDEALEEIRQLDVSAPVDGYTAAFRYCIWGKPLRGTLYPPVTVLFRRAKGGFIQDGHTHRLKLDGVARRISSNILHDDRKPLSHWLSSQQRYASVEAKHLLASPSQTLSRTDRIRRMGWPAPILVFLYTLLVKGCVLDGWPGWFYVLQRTLAETMIALEILDRWRAGAGEPVETR